MGVLIITLSVPMLFSLVLLCSYVRRVWTEGATYAESGQRELYAEAMEIIEHDTVGPIYTYTK